MKHVFPLFMIGVLAAFELAAEQSHDIPINPPEPSKNRPRMPAINPLPVCTYADGILNIKFHIPQGMADIKIVHYESVEYYSIPTESSISIFTFLYPDDTVEITTEEGNRYIAVYTE